MKQQFFEIISNNPLTDDVYKLELKGDTSFLTASGQFVNIKIDGQFLRRPISVCDCNDNVLTLIYKVVGVGTKVLSEYKQGKILDLLVGLGNGFNHDKPTEKPVLIGGGVGIPPLYNLCKRLKSLGKNVTVILGFNTKTEIFYIEEFKKIADEVIVCTVDGSFGVKGFVTDALKNVKYDYFYTCGPMPMFKAIENIAVTSGQYSFEERMGCGFGACMGCSCKTKYGNKRICVDGPVLEREEIIW